MSAKPVLRRAVLDVLAEQGPSTLREISDALGRNRKTVEGCIRETRKAEPDAMHIVEWRRSLVVKGKASPVYKAGRGYDRARPVPLTKSQISKRYDERHIAARRLRQRAQRGNPVPAWLVGLM